MELSPKSRVKVIGRGRVGGAFASRVSERGVLVNHGDGDGDEDGDADLVILCVPDGAIATVASSVPVGPWIAHVSGATVLAALAPHQRRFSVHPLQTFTRSRGAEQIDGAWAAVTAETAEARAAGWAFAGWLGLHPFDLDDDRRAIYHAGASIASNFLVTLHRAAVRAVGAAGAPPEALLPLMRRTMDNGFDLTGPIARGDRATVDAHLAAMHHEMPDLEAFYRVLAEATRP
jgi:predicted short-subunit dehydrogenase-like oxidoreductase (DUF2520 family)